MIDKLLDIICWGIFGILVFALLKLIIILALLICLW